MIFNLITIQTFFSFCVYMTSNWLDKWRRPSYDRQRIDFERIIFRWKILLSIQNERFGMQLHTFSLQFKLIDQRLILIHHLVHVLIYALDYFRVFHLQPIVITMPSFTIVKAPFIKSQSIALGTLQNIFVKHVMYNFVWYFEDSVENALHTLIF